MRKPMVTRTVKVVEVNVLCLNIETAEPFNQTVTVSRAPKDEKKLFEKAALLINNETVKAVQIVDKEEKEILYGMPEEDFVKVAAVLPPRKATDGTADAEE